MYPLRTALPAALVLLLSGCGLLFRFPDPPPAETLLPQVSSIKDPLPPHQNPGVIVCDPVVSGGGADLARFGRGVAHCLQVAVGGHAELGRTPSLNSLARLPQEMGRADLALSLREARTLAGKLGVTHAATGELRASGASCVLTYRLWELGKGKLVGASTVRGTRAQILSGLPQASRALASRLGVRNARADGLEGLDVAGVTLIGKLCWNPSWELTDSERALLRRTAARSPLAGAWLIGLGTPLEQKSLGPAVAALAPRNQLILADLGFTATPCMPALEPRISALIKQHPRSYPLAHAMVWVRRVQRKHAAELREAERMAKLVPRNPDAWLALGHTLSTEGFNERWLNCNTRAVRLDPGNVMAWRRVAESARYTRRFPLADAAIWRAMKLAPKDPAVYGWALSLSHGNAMARRQRIAEIAADQSWSNARTAFSASAVLREAGFEGLTGRIAQRVQRDAEARLQRNARDADAQMDLADALDEQQKPKEARKAYQAALAIRPSDARIRYHLALNLSEGGQTDDAIRELSQAIKGGIRSPRAFHELGQMLRYKGRVDEAIQALYAAVRSGPRQALIYRDLASALNARKRFREAIPPARIAVAKDPKDMYTRSLLSYAYGMTGNAAGCAEQCRVILRFKPDDIPARVNLGEALCRMGYVEDGRRELERVRRADDGEGRAEAERLLAIFR
jgi:tetratricopeptide (TPR) repeat protein